MDNPADQRSIIDRRVLAERIGRVHSGKKRNREVADILREALANGRAEIARRLGDEPGNGRAAARRPPSSTTRSSAWPMISSPLKCPANRSARGSRWSAWAAPAAAKWRRSATST